MNKKLLESIKFSMKRFSLKLPYNNYKKINNYDIIKIELNHPELNNTILFDSGKMFNKYIYLFLRIYSTENHYRLRTYTNYSQLNIINNVITINYNELEIKDNFDNYILNLKNPVLHIYLTPKTIKKINKWKSLF